MNTVYSPKNKKGLEPLLFFNKDNFHYRKTNNLSTERVSSETIIFIS